MSKYISVEFLKIKRTMLLKAVFIIPVFCAMVAVFFSMMSMPELSIATALNHWALLWLSGMIIILSERFHTLEKKSTKYSVIIGLPIDAKRAFTAKCLVVSLLTLVSTLLMGIIAFALQYFLVGFSPLQTSIENYCIALLLTWLVTLWQIPFYMYLSTKINSIFLLIFGLALSMILGAVMAAKSSWFISPWSYALRIQAPLIHVHPNGIPLDNASPLLNANVIGIAIIVSIVLLLAVLSTSSRLFSKMEVK